MYSLWEGQIRERYDSAKLIFVPHVRRLLLMTSYPSTHKPEHHGSSTCVYLFPVHIQCPFLWLDHYLLNASTVSCNSEQCLCFIFTGSGTAPHNIVVIVLAVTVVVVATIAFIFYR